MMPASIILKILVVFLLFCFTKASGGTCLSYGHSCWGGHGKRSGSASYLRDQGVAAQKRNGEWFLSKLLKSYVDNSNKISTFSNGLRQEGDSGQKYLKNGYQMNSLPDSIDINFRDDTKNLDFESELSNFGSEGRNSKEVILLTPEVQRIPVSKYKFFQILDQENSKKD